MSNLNIARQGKQFDESSNVYLLPQVKKSIKIANTNSTDLGLFINDVTLFDTLHEALNKTGNLE